MDYLRIYKTKSFGNNARILAKKIDDPVNRGILWLCMISET